jgi:anti-anti-sigma factor
VAVTVVFQGEFDLACRGDFKAKLTPAESDHEAVVDLTGVSYLDSSCIAELLLLSHARCERGLPPETILVAHGPVAKVLDVSGVGKTCRVVLV